MSGLVPTLREIAMAFFKSFEKSVKIRSGQDQIWPPM